MNAVKKRVDVFQGTEIWDFSPDDFLGGANKECWEYWSTLKGDERAPFKNDVDLLDLEQYLPYIVFMVWQDARLVIKFCGTEIAASFDAEPTGTYLDEIPNSEVTMKRHFRSRETVCPFLVHSPFYLAEKEFQDYETINLPLLDEHGKVCASLVCFSFLNQQDMQKLAG